MVTLCHLLFCIVAKQYIQYFEQSIPLSTHFLIVNISSFLVFLSLFTMESPSWLIIPKTPSGKSICHWVLKWKTPLLKLFLVNIFQAGIICCWIECFHGDVVSLIVLHCSQTIYSIFQTKYSILEWYVLFYIHRNSVGQLTFLLDKYQSSEIKTAFADAVGKVSTATRKAFYPLPHRKDKLILSFL